MTANLLSQPCFQTRQDVYSEHNMYDHVKRIFKNFLETQLNLYIDTINTFNLKTMKLEAKQMFAYYQMDYAGLESVSKQGK